MVRPKIERRIVKKPDYTCLKHGDVLESNQERLSQYKAKRGCRIDGNITADIPQNH